MPPVPPVAIVGRAGGDKDKGAVTSLTQAAALGPAIPIGDLADVGAGHHHHVIDRSAADAALPVRRSAGALPPLLQLLLADLSLAIGTLGVAHLAGVGLDGVVATAMPALWLALLVGVRAYESHHVQLGWWEKARRVARAGGALALACWALTALADPPARPGQLLLVAGGITAASVGVRLAVHGWQARRGARALRSTRVVVAGHGDEVARVVQDLRLSAGHSFEVVAVCLADPGAEDGFQVPVSVGFDRLAQAASTVGAQAVVVLPCPQLPPEMLRRVGWQLEKSGTDLYVGTPLLDVAPARTTVTRVGGLRMLHVRPAQRLGPAHVIKSAFDRALAGVVLFLLMPVLLALALAVKRDSPGPVIFRQDRVGRDGRHFTMFKFRTMHVGTGAPGHDLAALNESDGVLFKVRLDPRITRLGKILRRYSLDELPQLLNVMRGEMSLVGPRPALPSEVVRYDEDPRRRLAVKPGLTGLWQVSGRSDLSWSDTVRLDLLYVDNWSFSLDLVILCRTVKAVLGHRGAY
jgi:exopolysaccharide biosynthesis polyprenyl glycosylphosphotransferase